ncbi:hypothetical protein PT974_11035 [Cladobotryum mycophilum]|uniref:Integral membrane protein n=1 Tax=Cladobotryum mycophilum TaxID=491253 RepID=A0ABR0SCL2_9HYPO
MEESGASSPQPPQPPPQPTAGSSSRPTMRPPSQDASNTLSPIPSRTSANPAITPATPDASNEAQTEYFPALRVTPSARSRSSFFFNSSRPASVAGSDGERPTSARQRRPSIRVRRTSNSSLRQALAASSNQLPSTDPAASNNAPARNRPRSISQPTPVALPPPNPNIARNSRRVPQVALPRLTEEGSRPTMAELGIAEPQLERTTSLPDENLETLRPPSAGSGEPPRRLNRRRKLSRLLWPGATRQTAPPGAMVAGAAEDEDEEYHDDLVDFLDIIDPEIQTLSTLTNVQNSLFIPDLGNLINRRPTYTLTQYPERRPPSRQREEEVRQESQLDRIPTIREPAAEGEREDMPSLQRSNTITSRLSESHYAALPHGMRLEGWTDEEKWELDDHVRHMLHSRRSRFKRTMKGFGQYIRRPLGFFVTLYAVLITLFGLAWVLFLIGWIYVGDNQVYAIHIIDSVLVALFAIMGDGLAPFRAVDTYHMAFIVHYSRKIEKAKKKLQKQGLSKEPTCATKSDLPQTLEVTENGAASTTGLTNPQNGLVGTDNPTDSVERIMSSTSNAKNVPRDVEQNIDLEVAKKEAECEEEMYLTPAQLKILRHHQKKLSRSHSFYKPHHTFTHNPFPLSFLIAIVVLLDCHSCLQISLGATTWGIDYHHRPAAITTTILCVSITANLTAGLLITMGDKRTRKKEVVDLLERQELTNDAIKHLEDKRAKETSRSHDIGTEENGTDGVLIKEEA